MLCTRKTHQNKQGHNYLSTNLEHLIKDFYFLEHLIKEFRKRKSIYPFSTCVPMQFKCFICISSQ